MKSAKKRSAGCRSWLDLWAGREPFTTKKQRRGRSLSGALELLEAREVLASSSPSGYLPIALASDQPGAALLQDSNLQGAWGMAAAFGGGPLWVMDNTNNIASRYQGSTGSPFVQTSNVSIPDGAPTGIVFNQTGDFVVGSGNTSGPAMFLIASQNGDIDGWNQQLGAQAVHTAAAVSGADFTGLAVANNGTNSYLYAADFQNGKIDVFNSTFQPTTVTPANTTLSTSAFTDSNLPAGYAPYNIQLIGTQLYVTYALQNSAATKAPTAGAGNGAIDVYNLDGSLMTRLVAPGGDLNEPYGLVMAPNSVTFGDFEGDLLVANGGSGEIVAYDSSGQFQGAMNDGPGSTTPINIPGVRGLTLGNSGVGDSTTLFYSASNGGHGAVGEILNAFDRPLAAVPTTVSTAQGQTFSGTLATFADSQTNLQTTDFLAIIDWGDKSSTTNGTISASSGGGFNVVGVHTYPTAGTRQVTVTVSDKTHNVTVTAADAVTDPSFTSTGTTFTTNENQAYSDSVGGFADPTGPGQAGDYSALIDWGDGSTTAADSVTSTGANTYDVIGSHTYTQVGSFSVTAYVSENNGTSAATIGTIASKATINDPNHLTATGTSLLTATQGTSTTLAVATFTDTYAPATAGLFSASINWGDGTTASAGSISESNGVFTVTGSHAFVSNGPATINVSINDSPGTATATATATANVADGNHFTSVSKTFVAQSGQSFAGVVALFPDANPLVRASDFTATIDWGDGSATSVVNPTAANGTLTVSGSHTYTTAGVSPAVAVSVFENAPGTATATASSTAVVPKNDVTGTGGVISATAAAASTSQVLATFTPTGNNNASDFTATIDWGDGGPFTAASVTTSGGSTYTVVGSHTYALPGSYTPDVIVYEQQTGTTTATPAAAITATANVASPVVLTAATITGTELASTAYTVATFTDNNQPSLTATDFTATIDWGDGSSTTTGSVSLNSGVFTVTGSHAFTDEGTFSVKVTVTDTSPGNFSTSITATATMAEGDSFPSGTAELTATAGASFSGPLATFIDSNKSAPASDFSAVISWGDGQNDSQGTVSGSNGQFTVSGTHTYAQDGSFPLKVTITDDSGLAGAANQDASAEAIVMPGAGFTASSTSITATEGTAFSGKVVATFADPTSTGSSTAFKAQINWGDGTTSTAGTVTGSSGNYTVTGGHTYSDEGSFPVSVSIVETANGAPLAATSTATVADADALTFAGAGTFTATAGSTFSGAVATFIDANSAAQGSDFTATIDWGDGSSTTAGTVTASGDTLTVSGSHLYAQAGTDTAHVTLGDDSPSTVTTTANVTASVTTGTATATGSISGEVFNDVNLNGALDPNEPGVAGVSVTLKLPDGSTQPATTDANGDFTFPALAAGTYTVTESITADDGLNPTTVQNLSVTLTAGQDLAGVDFGNVLTSTIVPLVVSPPPSANSDANTAYIDALYQIVLDRTPDSAGLSGWQAYLQAHPGDRSTVAFDFWVSTEHRDDQINQYFPAFLGRQDDSASQAAWQNDFTQDGKTANNQTVAIGFLTTTEYQDLHSDTTALVDALYNDILSRSAGTDESYWVNQLTSGAQTLQQVVSDFIFGAEASTQIVDSFYSVFFHRAPDSSDLQTWVNDLTSQTLNADQVAIDLLSSDEFFNAVTADQAAQFTTGNSATLTPSTPTFKIQTNGFPIGAISATGLPAGVTFVDNKDGTGTLASSASAASGTYAIQLSVNNGVGAAVKQDFTLTIGS